MLGMRDRTKRASERWIEAKWYLILSHRGAHFTQRLFITKLENLSILTQNDEAKMDVAGRQWVLTWCITGSLPYTNNKKFKKRLSNPESVRNIGVIINMVWNKEESLGIKLINFPHLSTHLIGHILWVLPTWPGLVAITFTPPVLLPSHSFIVCLMSMPCPVQPAAYRGAYFVGRGDGFIRLA